ncbi:hypothetical protein HZB89_01655 [archaeon]|nr:hypothetical protein [archaeon]
MNKKPGRWLLSREKLQPVSGQHYSDSGYHSNVYRTRVSKGREIARKVPVRETGFEALSLKEKKALAEKWAKIMLAFRKAGLPVPRWWKADLRTGKGIEPGIYMHWFPHEKGWVILKELIYNTRFSRHKALIEGIASDLGKVHALGYAAMHVEDLWMVKLPEQKRVIIDVADLIKQGGKQAKAHDIIVMLNQLGGHETRMFFVQNYFKQNKDPKVWEQLMHMLKETPLEFGRQLYRQGNTFRP